MRLGLNGRFYAGPLTGVQRFAREASARLIERADDAVLFLPGGVGDADVRCGRCRVVRGRLTGHAWEQLELPRRAAAEGCDVVLNPANTAPAAGGPHVIVVHDVLALSRPEWYRSAFAHWYRIAQASAARRATAVATVSAWARREIERVLGVPGRRIHVVGQGVEPFDRPASADAVRTVRARYGLPERYLLAVAGADPRKNVDFLLDVLDRWRGRVGEPPALVVVGDARSRVHRPAARHAAGPVRPPERGGDGTGVPGAATPVIHVGRVDDDELRALYTGAAVLCFPSLAEGFGRPPLEAMGCGTPAVVAPYGPAREVLGDAARIAPLEADAWIAAIRPLLAPGAARDAAVEAGRRHALRHRWDDVADRLYEACRAAVLREVA